MRHTIFIRLALTTALLLPCLASADSFEDAVNEYLKGFKECAEANTLRAKNINEAKKKFDTYLKTLDRAIAIDSTILSTTQRDMDKNLRYCERVEQDIKRAEATPILEKGFTYCDNAKAALDAGDVSSAQQNLDEYKRYRDDAFIITESIMDVFAMASKVRACGRVEEKLAEATLKADAVASAMAKATTDYQSFLAGCKSAKDAITSPRFSLNDLDTVNQQFNNALKFKKAARENGDAFATLSTQSDREDSKQLKALVDSAAACEGEVSGHIRTATKNRRALEKDISDGTAQLQKSQAACEAAQKLSGPMASSADLAKAETEYNNSAALKRGVTTNAALINNAKTYNNWKESQDFARLMNSTEACQTKAAASIKAQKTALAGRNQKAEEEAARQRKLDEERKRLAAEEQAKKDELARKEEASRKARTEAAEAARLNDVSDDAVVNEDLGTLANPDAKSDKGRKSWTDLVQ